jgi:DNA-binding LytR/AlgR family response regulator
MIKTIIVDDEPLALEVLKTYIEQLDNVELVAVCNNALEANKAIHMHDVDLLCLDIHMPQLTGIEFLKSLKNPPLALFTTAHPDYALEGFDLDIVDYLLKPISLDRFMKAINKVEDRLQKKEVTEPEADHFYVKADKKLIKVHYNEILYIEGLKDYVILRNETSRVITLQTMKSLEGKLPSDHFIRVHRSYIVNIDKIKSIMGNMLEIMEKGQIKHIPVGKNYRDSLMVLIESKKI